MTDHVVVGRFWGVCRKNCIPKLRLSGEVVGHSSLGIELKALLDRVRGSPVKHGDETGGREDGQNGYLWSFSTPTIRYFVYDRSRAGSVPREVLCDDVEGAPVCDFYGGYTAVRCLHQRC